MMEERSYQISLLFHATKTTKSYVVSSKNFLLYTDFKNVLLSRLAKR